MISDSFWKRTIEIFRAAPVKITLLSGTEVVGGVFFVGEDSCTIQRPDGGASRVLLLADPRDCRGLAEAMSEARICPVPSCHDRLGTTRQGDPWLMCRRHWFKVDAGLQNRLWRAYRAWQRIERVFRKAETEGKSTGPYVLARAAAIQAFLDIRGDAIRQASRGEAQQLELAQ